MSQISTQSINSMIPMPSYSFNGGQSMQISKESLKIDYKSKDGDTVTLNYKKISASIYSNKSAQNSDTISSPVLLTPEESEKLRAKLKTELYSYKEALIKSFIESNGGKYTPANNIEDDAEVNELEAKMPEYWNADNTSQRIVDFATSFLSAFKGDSSEFIKTIKDAIETGFKQAKDMLGELSGPVGKLIGKTYKMTMDKLDAFEKQLSNPQTIVSDTTPADEKLADVTV